MATANEKILDKYIKHQVYLIQYSDHVVDQALQLLQATEADLRKTVLLYADKLAGRPIVSKRSRELLKQLDAEIKTIRSSAWDDIYKIVHSELQDLSIEESEYASKVIMDALPVNIDLKVPAKRDLKAIPAQTPYDGKLLGDWIKSGKAKDSERLLETVKKNVRLNATSSEIVSTVMGTKLAKYRDGAARKGWSGAEALVYTATTTVSSESRTAFNQKNSFVIKDEKFVATLDGGTTPLCMDNDGKVFAIGKGPHPALHFRCRSIRVPHITDESLGPRSFDPSTEKTLVKEYAEAQGLDNVTGRKRSNLPHGHKTKFDAFARKRRRELVGSVPDKLTYSEWLTRQSKDFQDEVLGVRRAALFRKGDLPLSKFINRKGQFLTLEQLKAKGIS